MEITQQQRQILCGDMLVGFSEVQQDGFFEICEAASLNPFTKQIYAMKQGGRLVPMVAIDGLRAIAQRTGQYAGQTPTMFCGTDGVWVDVWLATTPPAAAKVGIMRQGFSEPLYAVATMNENGGSSPIWNKMPCVMLAKTAEAMGLRKAFPNETVGLYIDSEVPTEAEAPPPTAKYESPANRVREAMSEQGVDMVPASQIEQPEPPPVEEHVECFTPQEIKEWLNPILETIHKTTDDLRTAMGRARNIDKTRIPMEPADNWPIEWQGRIEKWATKCADEMSVK